MVTISFEEMPKGAQKRFRDTQKLKLDADFKLMGFSKKPRAYQYIEFINGQIKKHIFAVEGNTHFSFIPKVISW